MKNSICLLGCSLLTLSQVALFGGSASWNVDSSGKWSNEKNWQQISGLNKIYPDGIKDVATFPPFIIKAPRVITVDGSYSVATLVFNSDTPYTLSSGQLNIYNGIQVTGKAEINSLLNLQNTINIMANDNFAISGNISGNFGIIKQGAGNLILSGSNNFTGSTTIQSGVLQAGKEDAFAPNSAVVFANTSGVILDLNHFPNKISSLSGGGSAGGNVLLGSANLTVGDDANTTYAGSIFGKGGLIKVGTGALSLTGTNHTYSGTTLINGGVLKASGANVLSPNSLIVLGDSEGAILDLCGYENQIPNFMGGGISGGNICLGSGLLIFGDNTDTAFHGSISGSGGITKNGSGTFSLTRASTYTGPTTINQGVFNLTGIISSPLTINQGATLMGSGLIIGNVMNYGLCRVGNGLGNLTVVGNYTQGKASTIEIRLDKRGTDCLRVTDTFTIEDNVTLNIIAPEKYSPGDTFEIITAGQNIVGMFSTINFPDQYSVTTSQTSVIVMMK